MRWLDNPCWWGEPWIETWRRREVCYICRGSSWTRDQTQPPALQVNSLLSELPGKPHIWWEGRVNLQNPDTEGTPSVFETMRTGSVMSREGACGRGAKARETCGWWTGVWRARPRAWKLILWALALTPGDPPGQCLWWSSHPTCD